MNKQIEVYILHNIEWIIGKSLNTDEAWKRHAN